ncbi:MAG TPA: peptidylprolyl isomerase [Gammaproteobacteria bacterium]|nr:peptidylprolyl isomerase [Gammaproteobacteria bacterium]
MKLRYLTLALAAGGLLAACDQLPMNSHNSTPTAAAQTAVNDTSPVLARVNGKPITEAVVDLYLQQMHARQPGSPMMSRNAVLNEVINLELARQSGEQEGLGKDSKIQLQIEQQQRAVLASAAIQHELKSNPITDEELKKIYTEQVPQGDEFKARHILVETEDEAKNLITELDKGADFSELAKEHSTGPSGKTGGELGWFSPKQMVAPFSEAAAGLEKGQYTKTPVQTQFGWHVIILDDKRASTPPAFEQVKPQLQTFVQKQRVQQYIAKLRSGANIEMTAPAAPAQPPAATPDSGAADKAAAEPATETAGDTHQEKSE